MCKRSDLLRKAKEVKIEEISQQKKQKKLLLRHLLSFLYFILFWVILLFSSGNTHAFCLCWYVHRHFSALYFSVKKNDNNSIVSVQSGCPFFLLLLNPIRLFPPSPHFLAKSRGKSLCGIR
ncbi:hypothetical protein, unlikely [Trypanosoma brucei gambiense DAL972]|uniref:Uncharacterized protein n=1 Tax=Trypanosoma brucei gambiense (strain MHOM/CI/86/DAL972) TaxID=679716 RepID=D0AAE2_TRYB9|nr:hypothetical protein, unlikely [Trypanosoma brucei gambiense DAL972]CBH18643.1 hypothetical protein, unlikely [Trypanosoma brucei gambiense DAL972]|eukprot:XP_011780907.1 hypothetical protein, unlikely [Trypanosoma brucei gambiense DAL972]